MKLAPKDLDDFTHRATALLAGPDRLATLLGALGISARHSPRAGSFNGICPACGEQTLHLRYKATETSEFAVFWVCRSPRCDGRKGRHSSVLGLVRAALKLNLAGSLKWLVGHLGHESVGSVLALPAPGPSGELVIASSIAKVAEAARDGNPALFARKGHLDRIDPALLLRFEKVWIDSEIYRGVIEWANTQRVLLDADRFDLFGRDEIEDSGDRFELLGRHFHYRVGSDGTVIRRNAHTGIWELVEASRARDGHLYVTVTSHGQVHKYHLAKLVLETFAGGAPEAGLVPVHRDGRAGNVRVENLRWGRKPKATNEGARNGRSKLTDEVVAEMRRRHAQGVPQKQLVADYGVSAGQVSKIVRGLIWTHVGAAPAA